MYRLECGSAEPAPWAVALARFEDANIYQTHAYGSVNWGEKSLEHHVLYRGTEAVVGAQSLARKIPLLGVTVFYVRWGPLWALGGDARGVKHLAAFFQRFKEYLRRYPDWIVRIVTPAYFDEERGLAMRNVLEAEGFSRLVGSEYQTFQVNLRAELAKIRSGFARRWGNRLRKAEGSSLEVRSGTQIDLIAELAEMYQEMKRRKGFSSLVDPMAFYRMQQLLPEQSRMNTLIVSRYGIRLSASIFSTIGKTGLCILSATTVEGRKEQSAYLAKMKTIEIARAHQCEYLDLGGRDPARAGSVDQFKAGMGGKAVASIGEYELSHGRRAYLAGRILRSRVSRVVRKFI